MGGEKILPEGAVGVFLGGGLDALGESSGITSLGDRGGGAFLGAGEDADGWTEGSACW